MSAERPLGGVEEEKGAVGVETSSGEGAGRRSLALLLVEAGVASELEVRRIVAAADAQGVGLGELVVARELLDEEGLARLVARQWGLPFLARGSLTIDPAAAGLLPLEQARLLGGCVIGIRERSPLVVVADPGSERLDALRAHLDTTPARPPASFAIVTASSLERLLHQLARIRPNRTDPAPPAANPAEPITPQPAPTDQPRAEHQRDTAVQNELLARIGQLERERSAGQQQLEHLQQQQEADDQQQAGEREHNRQLEARLDELERDRSAAEQQLAQLQQQLEAADQERADEREHSRRLQASRDRLQASLDSGHDRFNHLDRQVHDLNRKIEELLSELDDPSLTPGGEVAGEVPLIDLRLLEGVFSRDQRRQLAESLIAAAVGVKGEAFRSEIELLIAEVPGGNRYEGETMLSPERADEPQ